jgi:DNA repair exonuclease SbcCD ATPase subunit
MQDNLNLNNVKPISNPNTPIPMGPAPNEFTTLGYRIDSVERQIQQLQGQLHLYVPQRENELQLRAIQDTVHRIEGDVAEIRQKMNEITATIVKQEQDAQSRDAQQRESQDKLQIRVLWFLVSVVVTILTGILVGYIIHLF